MSLKVEIDVSGVVRAERTVNKSTNSIKRQFRTLNNSTLLVEKAIKDLAGVMDNSTSKMTKDVTSFANTTKKQLNNTSSHFSKFARTVKAAVTGYITVLASMEIKDFITDTFSAGIAIDSLERSFVAITGSAEGAAFQMNYIGKTADALGLPLGELRNSYKDILAASKGTTLEGEGVRKIFTAISKASAVLGMSADDTKGSLRALSQMISKGNVQAEELRGQLGERLPGAFMMAAEAMEVTTEQLNDMLENGEVLATDLLPALADVLENRFGVAAENAGDRAQAAFTGLGNAALRLQETLMKSGLMDFMKDMAIAATASVNAVNKLAQGQTREDKIATLEQEIKNTKRLRQEIKSAGNEYIRIEENKITKKLAREKAYEAWKKQGTEYRTEIASTRSKTPLDAGKDVMDVLTEKQISAEKELARMKEDLRNEQQRKALNALTRFEAEQQMMRENLAKDDVSKANKLASEIAKKKKVTDAKALKAAEIELRKFQRLQDKNAKWIMKNNQDITNAKVKMQDDWTSKFQKLTMTQGEVAKVALEQEYKDLYNVTNDKEALLKQYKAMKDAIDEKQTKKDLKIDETNLGTLDLYIKQLEEATTNQQMFEDLTVTSFTAMGDAISDFVKTGEMDFKSFASTIIDQMIDMAVQAMIVKPIMDSFMSYSGGTAGGLISALGTTFAFANGGVASGSSISGASNSIISSPTFFPSSGPGVNMFANGGSWVGEGGREEGILPLTKVGADLGVKADISGSAPIININVTNNAGDSVGTEVTSSTDDMGNTIIGIVVDAALRDKGGFGSVIRGVANRR